MASIIIPLNVLRLDTPTVKLAVRAGADFLVTQNGKPFARLTPVAPNDAVALKAIADAALLPPQSVNVSFNRKGTRS